jgi:hypothetical protein
MIIAEKPLLDNVRLETSHDLDRLLESTSLSIESAGIRVDAACLRDLSIYLLVCGLNSTNS